MMEDIGPAQSAPAADQKEHGDEFAAAADFDGNDLTGGNLKLLTRSLKALAQDGGEKSEDLEVALDVRPILVQASNLLVSSSIVIRGDPSTNYGSRQCVIYNSLRRRANARNVSFRNSLQWPVYIYQLN